MPEQYCDRLIETDAAHNKKPANHTKYIGVCKGMLSWGDKFKYRKFQLAENPNKESSLFEYGGLLMALLNQTVILFKEDWNKWTFQDDKSEMR